jgi:putative hemolysin
MSDVLVESLILLALVLANGFFALSEMALVAARRARLQQRAESGESGAAAAIALQEAPERFLSTAQIGITLIGIMAGAFGGATLAEEMAAGLARLPVLAPYADAVAVGVVVLAVTYLSLVIGELVPKRLAMSNAESIAARVAAPMRTLSRVVSPLVRLLTWSTDFVVRILGARNAENPPVTAEEIEILMRQGAESGVFEVAEQSMVERVFRLDERRIEVLMTPRTDVDWLDLNEPQEETRRRLVDGTHSYLPVAAGGLDHVTGVIRARDVLARCLAGEPLDLKALAQPPLFVPESATPLEVLELFRLERSSVALVIDEYGGLLGLVSATDLLEAIVGRMPQVEDTGEAPAVRRQDGSWLLAGLLPIDELKDLLELDELPGESEGRFQTLGGYMMDHLGRIPLSGDRLDYGGWRFEVVDMDGRRVDKVLATRQDPQPDEV